MQKGNQLRFLFCLHFRTCGKRAAQKERSGRGAGVAKKKPGLGNPGFDILVDEFFNLGGRRGMIGGAGLFERL